MEDGENESTLDMSVTIKKSFYVSRIVQDYIQPTEITIELIINPFYTDDTPDYISKAKDRFAYWVEKVLDESFIFHRYNRCGFDIVFDEGVGRLSNRIMMTPAEPTDEMIGWLMMAKFNAFGEGHVVAEVAEVTSSSAAGISIELVGDPLEILPEYHDWMPEGPGYFDTPWWTRNDASALDTVTGDDEDTSITPKWAYSIDDRLNRSVEVVTKVPKFSVIDLNKNDEK